MDIELINFVKKSYNLDIHSVEKLNRGSANIYLLNKNEYILKEFQEKYSKDDIEKEITIINHLSNFKIKVPEYIKTKKDTYYDIYKEKVIIIQRYIEGYTLDNNKGNYEQTIECAEYYGKLVNALKTLPIKLPDANLSGWYNKDTFDISIKKHKDLLPMLGNNEIDEKIRKDILEKIEILEDIKTYNFDEMKYLTVSNTLGDYSVQQFIYKDGKINAIIDFVSASKMPICWEIIRSYSYIDIDAKDGYFNLDTFIQYVKTVNKYIKLNKYDLKYMAYLYLIQILNSTYGYKEYISDHSKTNMLDFGCFRTNICRYLYKNAEIIKDRLISEIN